MRDLTEMLETLKTLTVEGIPFRILYGEISPGDTYLAPRNPGIDVLTCKRNNKEEWTIQPVESAPSYDAIECVKIELLID